MKIHHIGYLVKDIDAARQEFLKLSYTIYQETTVEPEVSAAEISAPRLLPKRGDIIWDGSRKIEICFLEKDGYIVELVSPKDNTSVVFSLLKKYRNSPYHLCYLADDFDAQIKYLAENGYTLISEPLAAPALKNRRAAFLMSPLIGMIEVLEEL